MDAVQIAQFLAPLLPHLLKGGKDIAQSAAGELGKNIGADTWQGLKALAERIQQKAEEKPALQEALADAETHPQDEDAIAALRLQLRKLLQADPDLRAEAARVLDQVPAGVIAWGERSVAVGGHVQGSTIVTGDQNVVTGRGSRGIAMIPVESSMINAVGYDRESRRLQVIFNTGQVYCYEGVPPEVFEGLLAADSKGRYMRAHIIAVYPYRRGSCPH